MCFSASASFTASAVLLLCGIVALKKAKKNQRFFAATPLLFSAQQFTEGIVWQTLQTNASAVLAAYGFLFFVFMVWPLWPSFSLKTMASKKEQKLLLIPLFSGAIIALWALGAAVIHQPTAMIMSRHIQYSVDNMPHWLWLTGTVLYLIATIAPCFIVKLPHLWIIGTLLSLSYLATFVFYFTTITSVWCFFGAILSTLILLIVG